MASTSEPPTTPYVNSQQGWHYVTHTLARAVPYHLTHGANSLRACLKLTAGKG